MGAEFGTKLETGLRPARAYVKVGCFLNSTADGMVTPSGVWSKPVGDVQKISPRPRVPASPCQFQPTTYRPHPPVS
jgi:hypothetical protein